jgi:hypothetical protein
LSHCAKFVDLNPADMEKVNGVKLSLNLNFALAYLNLQNPYQALRVCNDALAIDGENAMSRPCSLPTVIGALRKETVGFGQ